MFTKTINKVFCILIAVVILTACGATPTRYVDVNATVESAVAAALTVNAPTAVPPTATPDLQATIVALEQKLAAPADAVQPTEVPPTAEVSNVDIDTVVANAKNLPFKVVKTKDDKGRDITIIDGFDLREFGGDDTGCTLSQLDDARLNEEVGSQDENCKIVVEWSLKNKDITIISGVYAVKPHEWFRLTYEMANGQTRFVGSLWYLPRNWNAHMFAGNIAAEWAPKNPGLTTIVGLSPTDDFVLSLWKAAEAIDR